MAPKVEVHPSCGINSKYAILSRWRPTKAAQARRLLHRIVTWHYANDVNRAFSWHCCCVWSINFKTNFIYYFRRNTQFILILPYFLIHFLIFFYYLSFATLLFIYILYILFTYCTKYVHNKEWTSHLEQSHRYNRFNAKT